MVAGLNYHIGHLLMCNTKVSTVPHAPVSPSTQCAFLLFSYHFPNSLSLDLLSQPVQFQLVILWQHCRYQSSFSQALLTPSDPPHTPQSFSISVLLLAPDLRFLMSFSSSLSLCIANPDSDMGKAAGLMTKPINSHLRSRNPRQWEIVLSTE
jgi:hypothetical protein